MAIVMSATAAIAASPPAFDRMVVFGDSLSDTGNAGRFSNGPVWVEMLADRLGVNLRAAQAGGSNFAVGGARLDPAAGPYGLRAQVDRFLDLRGSTGRTLHVVYGGGNDLLAALSGAGPAQVDAAIAALRTILTDLVAAGATDLLVPNLPDVGITPAVRGYGAEAAGQARRLTAVFNAQADAVLRELAATAPGELRLYRLDVFAMAERVRADPAAFGFTDITTPCGGSTRCEGHLFWDQVHPTTYAHGRLAEAALRELAGQDPPP